MEILVLGTFTETFFGSSFMGAIVGLALYVQAQYETQWTGEQKFTFERFTYNLFANLLISILLSFMITLLMVGAYLIEEISIIESLMHIIVLVWGITFFVVPTLTILYVIQKVVEWLKPKETD